MMRTTATFLTLGPIFFVFGSAVGCAPEGPSIAGTGGSTLPMGTGGEVLGSGGSTAAGGTLGSGGGVVTTGGANAAGGTSSGGATIGTGGASTGGSGGMGTGGVMELPPSVTPGTCLADLGGYQNGSVTKYWFDQGTTQVNCGNPELGRNPDRLEYVDTNDGKYFGAMNTADYDTAATCGACVEVTRDGSKKVTITVADQCPVGSNPKCKTGHIDLSREAFDQLANSGSEGYLGTSNGGEQGQISWKYVPCPEGSNVFFTLKEADNEYWNQIMVSGHRWAIDKVEVRVDGTWVNAVRQEHNYWEPPEGIFGEDLPYRVRVTDVNGSVLEAPVDLKAGGQDTGLQFECN